MKAKEFVTEAKKKADPYAAQGVTTGKSASAGKEIADFIKKNCKPWLSVSNNGNTRAYRGVHSRGLDTESTPKKPKCN